LPRYICKEEGGKWAVSGRQIKLYEWGVSWREECYLHLPAVPTLHVLCLLGDGKTELGPWNNLRRYIRLGSSPFYLTFTSYSLSTGTALNALSTDSYRRRYNLFFFYSVTDSPHQLKGLLFRTTQTSPYFGPSHFPFPKSIHFFQIFLSNGFTLCGHALFFLPRNLEFNNYFWCVRFLFKHLNVKLI
jgi:hypothetical protein